MMLNSKIPLPQRSLSSSGLDFRSPPPRSSLENRQPPPDSLSFAPPKSRIPLPSVSSSNSSSSSSISNGSPAKKATSPSRIPLPVLTSEVQQTSRVMRKYETFVMTGERMLCITKTPAKTLSHKSLPSSPAPVDAVDHVLANGGHHPKREGPVLHSPESPHPPEPIQQQHHDDDSISSSSPVDNSRLIEEDNESISSSSEDEVETLLEAVGKDEDVRSPSMIPFTPSTSSGGPEGDSDLESLHSYHPPPKIVDVPSAIRLAKRLFLLDGFRKSDVSRHLSRNNEYNQVVAEEYLKFFDFSNLTLDGALRLFLGQFCLTGETQERERVLFYFSKRYRECNPETKAKFLSCDAVHTLTCAIMLLNTDLHGDSGQRKMTSGEFIKNLSELNEGQDFPRELLKSLYYAIKHEPIPWALNNGEPACPPPANMEKEEERDFYFTGAKEEGADNDPGDPPPPALLPKPINLGSGLNPFLALPDPLSSTDYKKGYVLRKCCVDPNGKRTKLGRRSWKMFYLSLRDMVLYCFKDEKSLRAPGAFEDLNQAIRIHHGLALRASDYTKKQFVFRLHTCDQAEYLFQTSDEKELLTWIDAINYVVASYSSPKLPAPISSAPHSRFQRPLLPSSKSKLSPGEQLGENESALSELRRELEDHLQHPPPPKQAALLSYFKDKQDYLGFEVQRYETYILTLRTKFSSEQQQSGEAARLHPDNKAQSLERIY